MTWNDDEARVFVAACRRLVGIDDVVSFPELGAMRRIKAELGAERWARLAAEANRRLSSEAELVAAWSALPTAVRQDMGARLVALAELDGVDDRESAFLDRLGVERAQPRQDDGGADDDTKHASDDTERAGADEPPGRPDEDADGASGTAGPSGPVRPSALEPREPSALPPADTELDYPTELRERLWNARVEGPDAVLALAEAFAFAHQLHRDFVLGMLEALAKTSDGEGRALALIVAFAGRLRGEDLARGLGKVARDGDAAAVNAVLALDPPLSEAGQVSWNRRAPVAVLQRLMAAGTAVDRYLAESAAQSGNEALVEWILEHGPAEAAGSTWWRPSANAPRAVRQIWRLNSTPPSCPPRASRPCWARRGPWQPCGIRPTRRADCRGCVSTPGGQCAARAWPCSRAPSAGARRSTPNSSRIPWSRR